MPDVLDGSRKYPLLLPLAPGCGAIGLVEKVGPDATRLAPGQLVFCDPPVRSRDDALSPDVMLQGWIAPGTGPEHMQSHFRNGPFAQRMLLPLENAVPLPGLENVLRGQYMYPRSAPTLLARLIRSGVLSLEPFKTKSFSLDRANEAVEYAAGHGGPFKMTVLTPTA